jgi:hypothetical protein
LLRCIPEVAVETIGAETNNARFDKELAVRKAREWTVESIKSRRYLGPIKKNMETSIGKFTDLSIDQRKEAWELFCQFSNIHQQESRVTLS